MQPSIQSAPRIEEAETTIVTSDSQSMGVNTAAQPSTQPPQSAPRIEEADSSVLRRGSLLRLDPQSGQRARVNHRGRLSSIESPSNLTGGSGASGADGADARSCVNHKGRKVSLAAPSNLKEISSSTGLNGERQPFRFRRDPSEVTPRKLAQELSQLKPAEFWYESERLQSLTESEPIAPEVLAIIKSRESRAECERQIQSATESGDLFIRHGKIRIKPAARSIGWMIPALEDFYSLKERLGRRLPRLETSDSRSAKYSVLVHRCERPGVCFSLTCGSYTTLANARRLISAGCASWDGDAIRLTPAYIAARAISEAIDVNFATRPLSASNRRIRSSPGSYIGGNGGMRYGEFGKEKKLKGSGKGFLHNYRREMGWESIEARRDVSSTSAYRNADGKKLMQDTLESGRASIADLEKADAVSNTSQNAAIIRKPSQRLAKGQTRDTKRNSQGRNLSPVEWAEIKSRLTIEEGEVNLRPVESR